MKHVKKRVEEVEVIFRTCDLCGNDVQRTYYYQCCACGRDVCDNCRTMLDSHPIDGDMESYLVCNDCRYTTIAFRAVASGIRLRFEQEIDTLESDWRLECQKIVKEKGSVVRGAASPSSTTEILSHPTSAKAG